MFMILTLIDTKLMASVITCPVRDCLKNTLPSCDSRHITFPENTIRRSLDSVPTHPAT